MRNLDFLDQPEPKKSPKGKAALAVFVISILILVMVFGSIANAEKNAGNPTVNYDKQPYNEETYVTENTQSSPYILGEWGEKFVRSNGYTYPFEFTLPLQQCGGFTLDYYIADISEGNLNGNFRFEIYVRTTSGQWKSVELFTMDGYEKTVTVRFDEKMDIEAVAVVCQKKGNVTFSAGFGVREIQY